MKHTFKRVVQVGFDIAEDNDIITDQDRENLADAIREVIDNFYDSKGKALPFFCVNGVYWFEDMSHAYDETFIKEINERYNS